VGFVYSICNAYTQDPEEIGYVIATHWAHYISPILNDWTEENEKGEDYDIPIDAPARLNSLFRQTIGSSVPILYPRIVDAGTWISQINPQSFKLRFSEMDRNTVIHGRKGNENTSNDTTQIITSLPRMARYLLVASYLGSFNPAKMDVRILGQMRDPTKKFRKETTRKARPEAALKVREPTHSSQRC
jgi:origin recognition complex subunit 5